jgi:hypothetical protein
LLIDTYPAHPQGEVSEGEYGMAKGLLAAARKKGAANMIAAFKKGLPEVLPRWAGLHGLVSGHTAWV